MRGLRLAGRGRRALIAAVLLPAATGCGYSLPLGGVAVGRGRPLPHYGVEVGMSGGRSAELSGTLPALGSASGLVVNPVPEGRDRTTGAVGLDPLGVTFGVADGVDVGLSFSRGLHSMIRVAHGSMWAVSVSPAVFLYSAHDDDLALVGRQKVGHVTNVNATALLSVVSGDDGVNLLDAYAGAGLTRFSGRLEYAGETGSHAGTAPTVVLGVKVGRRFCGERCVPTRQPRWALAFESDGSWVRQRSGRRDFVPTTRVFLSFSLDRPH